jgi:L-threonylcarbamoyladenylate synthase
VILRPGGLALEEIGKVAGKVLTKDDDRGITAPGQLASHYAPNASMRLNATEKSAAELLLGFGDVAGADLTLSREGNLIEAAANLFASLHRLDAMADGRSIAVSPIPETGLGIAINDRLRRAAAPRQ